MQKQKKEFESFVNDVFNALIDKGKHAIRCINKARRLDSGHNNKNLLIYDLIDKANITKLFEMLLENERWSPSEDYPADEEIFWQNSLWAQKLASVLLWADYVKCKLIDSHDKSYLNKMPKKLSSLSTRPTILIWWLQARKLHQEFISKKLLTFSSKPVSISGALNGKEDISKFELTQEADKFIKVLDCFEKSPDKLPSDIHNVLKAAYYISRNLYFAHAYSRIISRKNFDLIFPRLPQLYYVQWKLLLNLIVTIWVTRKDEKKSIKDFSFLLQKLLVKIDEEWAPDNRIPASHFDYEYIYLRLSETLESSINLINNTSNTHKAIFQNKYFCHDDFGDPEFHTDYMLAYMFTPSALLYQKDVKTLHEQLCKKLEEVQSPSLSLTEVKSRAQKKIAKMWRRAFRRTRLRRWRSGLRRPRR